MVIYILGNGFDINNGLKTKYSDFRNWLKKNYWSEYKKIVNLFNLDGEWKDFEDKIADSFDQIKNLIDNESNDFNFIMDDYHEEWRRDSDRSYAVSDYVQGEIVNSGDMQKLIHEWILSVLKEGKINKRYTRNNIINFNYTDYIFGENVFHIHESVSSGVSLHVGHSRNRRLENKFSNSDFGNVYPDPNEIFNQLSKYPRIATKMLKLYLIDKKVDKLVFYGFSFGKQDEKYFDIFERNLDVDFYYHEGRAPFNRIKNKFPKVNFKDSKKWNNDFL